MPEGLYKCSLCIVELWPRRETRNPEKCEALVDFGREEKGRRDARGPAKCIMQAVGHPADPLHNGQRALA